MVTKTQLNKNKATSQRLVEEVFNQGDLATVSELFSNHITELQELVKALRKAFPDLHCIIEEELAEGNRVALRLTFGATQTGEWLGIPASGRAVSWAAVLINHFENGKIVGGGLIQDHLNLLWQLGAVPCA